MNDPHSDRRQDLRVPIDVPVTIRINGRKSRARIVDLSCSGARIAYENSHVDAPTGAHRVQVEQDPDPIELVALPVWQNRFSYGVRFLLTDDVERLAIAELLDRASCHRAA